MGRKRKLGRKARNVVIEMGSWMRQNVATDRGERFLYNSSRTALSLGVRRTGGVGGALPLSIDVVVVDVDVPISPVSIDVDFSDCCCCRSL